MRRYFFIIITLVSIFISTSAMAAVLRLHWDFLPEDEPNISGFRIFYDTISHHTTNMPGDDVGPQPYANVVKVENPSARFHDIELSEGKYYFAVNSYNKNIVNLEGEILQSTFSNEVTVIVGTVVPTIPPPVIINYTITYP